MKYLQGWHCDGELVPFPDLKGSKLDDALDNWAPFLARILAVLKFSGTNFNIVTTEAGQKLIKTFEEVHVYSTV